MFQIDSSQLSLGFQKNDYNEEYLYAVNHDTFARVSSDVFFKHEYAEILNKDNTLYLIVGTDSGLLIKYLSDHPPSKGSTYLFIEFTEVIEHALLDFQPDENKQIYLTDYEHWQGVARQYELSKYIFLNQITIIQSFCVKDNFLSQYRSLWKQIEQELSDLRWQHSVSSGAHVFIKTQIENLNENQFSAIKLENLLVGKTAVLLAGGPSLDLYIDWVEANRDKLIVIAVSRIAKRLLKTSITPDFFAAIDPHQVGFDVSKEVLNFSQKSILLYNYHLTPLVSSQWQGPKFFIGPCYPWYSTRQPKYIDAPGPTVTNVALQTAVFMGLKRIILLGVDLCYSPEGYSHASGSIEHKAGPMTSQIGQLVTTNNDKIAETENSLFNAIKSLASQAKKAKESHCQFINPSPHAAKVEDVDYIPIGDIKLTNKVTQPIELIRQILPEDMHTAQQVYYYELISEIKSIQTKLKKIITLTKKGLSYNKKFFKNNTPEENFKFKIKMDKVENHLNNDFDNLQNLCRSYGIRAFLNFLKPASDDLSNEEIKEWGDIYYEAYKIGAEDLHELLTQALNRSQKRILELDANKYIDELCTFWKEDNSPGRALIYKNTHYHDYEKLSKKEQEKINQSIILYEKVINSKPEVSTQYANIKQRTDLSGSETKAYDLFLRHDNDGLKRMIKGLKKHNGEQAEDILNLSEAYIYELKGQKDEAITAYEKVHEGNVKIAALKQLVVIYLGSNDLIQAETALYNLSCMSLIYVPKLANLYKIQKRYKDALDTYTSYLEIFPEDIMTLVKLGALYQEINETEAAQFVYKHILTIDSDNILAKTHLQQLQQSVTDNNHPGNKECST